MRFTYQSGAQPLKGFTIQRGIHRGGFGEVYFAHSDGGKEVALKLLHDQDCEVEVRGVTQCLNLKHPNLINLFDVKTDGEGDQWVVMEYVAGSSLEDVLASFPDGLPLTEVRDWLSGLVAGVSHLHDRGIVHRDLKPANVYRENGIVKIGDVGLSKRLDSGGSRQHTQSVGTVYYMAPEVARGQYGPEVDVYSLGVMLYELITGKLPFTGETTAEILMKHLTAPPDLSPVPRPLRPMLARALEKDPRKRTPSARQLELEFLRASELTQSGRIPESAFVPPTPPPRTNGAVERSSSQRVQIPVSSAAIEQNGYSHHQPSRATGPSHEGRPRFLAMGIIALIVLSVVIPKTYFVARQSIKAFWILPSIALAIWIYFTVFVKSRSSQRAHGPEVQKARVTVPAKPATFEQRSTARTNAEPIKAPVMVPIAERLPQLASSIGAAGFVASLLSAGIFVALQKLNRSTLMPSVEHAALFAAVSIMGSWLLLAGPVLTSNPSWTKRDRWLARIALGIILGSGAYALDQFLMVNLPRSAYLMRPVISSIGNHPLNVASVDPTWLGYAVFFAGWFSVRKWPREVDPGRKYRLSIGVTAAAVVLAYLVSVVFAFPQWYAMLWAGTISVTLQLISPWTPRQPSARGR